MVPFVLDANGEPGEGTMIPRALLRVFGAAPALLLGAGAAFAQEHLTKPLVLRGIGSFYVGGGLDSIEFSGSGGARPGRVWANAMYVQYMIPQKVRHPNPLVLWSGGCHTGAEFETTPDGREGWLLHFVRAGYRVYVVDATWRGRSPFVSSTTMGVRQGALPLTDIPSTLTCDSAIAAPPTGGFRLYDSNFPIEALHEYMAQVVPDYFFSPQNGPPPNVAALEALLRRIGPSVVLAHSQGGCRSIRPSSRVPNCSRATWRSKRWAPAARSPAPTRTSRR
jgi:hypothetical protein